MISSFGFHQSTVNSKFLKAVPLRDSIVNNISENVKSLNFQISSIQERIKNIENSDIDGKLELLYLKKDIEAIKRYMDVHYLSNITFRNSRKE